MKLFLNVVKEDLVLIATAVVLLIMTVVLGTRLAIYICMWGNSMMYIAVLGMAIFIINAYT